MKKSINNNKSKHLIILVIIYSIYFFNQEDMLGNFPVLSIAVLWWLLHTNFRYEETLQDSLLSLMIYSIPLSFISVNGSVDTYVYFNWFNIFSGMFLVNNLWSLSRQDKKHKFRDGISMTFVLSFIGLLVSFLMNQNKSSGNGYTQFILIFYYLLIVYITYKNISKITRTNLDNKILLKQYGETISITALFVLIQFILYRCFDLIFGRIEFFEVNRIAIGFLNFDYSFLSLFILSGIFFLMKKLYNHKQLNIYAVINLLILISASIITSARTGIIAVVIVFSLLSLIHLILLNTFKLTQKKRIILTVVSAILLMILLYFVGSKRGFGGSGRSESFVLAYEAIKNNIFFGNGLLFHVMDIIPHNFFIQYWLQTGLVFLLPIITLLSLLMIQTFKSNRIIFYNLSIILTGAMFIPDILVSRFLLVMLILSIYTFEELQEKRNDSRIAHLVNSGGYSGAEKILLAIIESTPVNFESYYVSLEGPIESILNEKHIKHIKLSNNSNISTRSMVVKNDIDIVYAHDFKSSIKSAFLFSDKVVISHIHQNPDWFSKLNIKTVLFLISSLFISKIIYVSEEAENSFYFSKIVQNKTSVLLNYVNEEEIVLLSNMQSELPIENYDIAYLGRLDAVKNPLKFIDIISIVKKDFPLIEVVIMGDGVLREEMESKIKSMGLEENITVLGYQKNPYPILKKTKVMVLPSQWEGFGLSAVESLILGVPVIASNVGGLKTILKNDGGILCDNELEFVNGIQRLLNDDKLLKIYSDRGKKSVSAFTNKNSWSNNIFNILKSYE